MQGRIGGIWVGGTIRCCNAHGVGRAAVWVCWVPYWGATLLVAGEWGNLGAIGGAALIALAIISSTVLNNIGDSGILIMVQILEERLFIFPHSM